MRSSKKIAGFIFLLAFFVTSCSPQPYDDQDSERILVFGTDARLELHARSEDVKKDAISSIVRVWSDQQMRWHAWEMSRLTILNDCLRSGSWCLLDEQINLALESSAPYVMSSQGYFDPSMGELVRLYGFHTSDYPITTAPPTPAQLDQWRAHPASLADLDFSHDRTQIRSSNPNIRLDFNAIAEGMALKSANDILTRMNIESALINFGGDVSSRGDNAGKPWSVGIRDPRGGVFASLALHDGEYLFSSGAYTKYRRSSSGKRWPHVINPKTGEPAADVLASSVLSFNPLLADTAATALMAAGPDKFRDLVESMGLSCAMLLTEQGKLLITEPLQRRIKIRSSPEIETVASGSSGSC